MEYMAVKSLRTRKGSTWHDGREVCVVRTPAKVPNGIGPNGEFEPTAKASGKRRAKGPGLMCGEKPPEIEALDRAAENPGGLSADDWANRRRASVDRGSKPRRKSSHVWRGDRARNARRQRQRPGA